MKALTLIIALSISSADVFAQGNSSYFKSIVRYSTSSGWDTKQYTSTAYREWAPSKAENYKSQGKFHSAYISLNEDSTFLFWTVYEVGAMMSVGKWQLVQDSLIILTWDYSRTVKLASDRVKTKRLYRYTSFAPLAVDWKFIRREHYLEPISKTVN